MEESRAEEVLIVMEELQGPRFLYLHGFASGPKSKKGVEVEAHFAKRGIEVERLNLRLPSFENLRVSAMIDEVRLRIGGDHDRAVLFGSSLGGLVAARVAEIDPRVISLVLLAPAFDIARRWRARLGENGLRAWEESGFLQVDDHTTGKPGRVDFGFLKDLEATDPAGTLPDVRVPTSIIHGVRDDVVDIARSRDFARGRRHVKLHEVDDAHELVASLPTILARADEHLAMFL